MRTLDPSTELAPFTAGRLKAALRGGTPPALLSHCRVVRVDEDSATGSGYIITAEQSRAPKGNSDGEAMETDQQATAIVSQSRGSKSKTEETAAADSVIAAPEIVQVRTRSKPILATGFHSGVAKTVNHLFEWTEEALCAGSGTTGDTEVVAMDAQQEPVASSHGHGHGHGHGQGQHADAGLHADSCGGGDSCDHDHRHGQRAEHSKTSLQPSAVLPTGDPKLTKCDESTICPGLFLCGPQVRQDDQIFCFVYKYRQRFADFFRQVTHHGTLDLEFLSFR